MEVWKLGGLSWPELTAAEDVSLAVDGPQGGVLPVERLADRAENLRRGIGEGGRLDECSRHDVLGHEPSLGQPVAGQRTSFACHGQGWRL